MHISPPSQTFHSHAPVIADFQAPLPSASQSHFPSLRHTPSFHSYDNIHTQNALSSPLLDHQNDNISHSSQRIQPLSPIASAQPHGIHFAQPHNAPFIAAPQPIPLPPNHIPPRYAPFQQPQFFATVPQNQNPPISYINSSLPSTKDVPTLTGKHDWGPWHSVVRTLILNANLLGHIADDPLPGAVYDPGLWPTYPPTIHRRSTHSELQSFMEWWSHDRLASHSVATALAGVFAISVNKICKIMEIFE